MPETDSPQDSPAMDIDRYPQISFTVGMPNMVPDQLSEVEFMKIFAEFQWCQLGDALGCPSHLLKSEQGERLYASVVQVESHFGHDDNIGQYQEGDVVHGRGTVRFHAKHFVEGWSAFAKEPVAREVVEQIQSKSDLFDLDATWVYMTNAIVARMADNNRLKTYGPAGIQDMDVPQAPEKPLGISEHEQVMQTGEVEPICREGLVPIRPVDDAAIPYQISLENDMNGAGLLYFARYIAMMNYAERIFLLRRLTRPFSQQLIRFMSTEHRRSYFYANAGETDEVLIHCSGALIDADATPKRGPLRTRALRFQFAYDMHRKSDGVLMAKSIVTRALSIPNRFNSLRAEARRFAKMILDEAR